MMTKSLKAKYAVLSQIVNMFAIFKHRHDELYVKITLSEKYDKLLMKDVKFRVKRSGKFYNAYLKTIDVRCESALFVNTTSENNLTRVEKS